MRIFRKTQPHKGRQMLLVTDDVKTDLISSLNRTQLGQYHNPGVVKLLNLLSGIIILITCALHQLYYHYLVVSWKSVGTKFILDHIF